MLHNGPPPHTVAVVLRESSKGKSQFEVVNSDGKSPRHEGRKRQRKLKENSNALRRTASFVFVFKCIRRRFIFVCCGVGICGLLRHKQPRKTTHPHGWRPLERAYLLLGTWHFGISRAHSRAEHSEAALGWPSSTLVQSTWRMGTHTHTHTHFRKQENTSSPQCSMLDSIYSNCIAGVPGKRARRERDLSICVREYLCDHNNFDPISSAAAAAADRSVRTNERVNDNSRCHH